MSHPRGEAPLLIATSRVDAGSSATARVTVGRGGTDRWRIKGARFGRPKQDQPVPKLYGLEFVQRLHAALSEGDLSARRAASLLEMTIQDLADLFRAYELTVPFVL